MIMFLSSRSQFSHFSTLHFTGSSLECCSRLDTSKTLNHEIRPVHVRVCVSVSVGECGAGIIMWLQTQKLWNSLFKTASINHNPTIPVTKKSQTKQDTSLKAVTHSKVVPYFFYKSWSDSAIQIAKLTKSQIHSHLTNYKMNMQVNIKGL